MCVKGKCFLLENTICRRTITYSFVYTLNITKYSRIWDNIFLFFLFYSYSFFFYFNVQFNFQEYTYQCQLFRWNIWWIFSRAKRCFKVRKAQEENCLTFLHIYIYINIVFYIQYNFNCKHNNVCRYASWNFDRGYN